MHNWDAVGWCEGVIKETNHDGARRSRARRSTSSSTTLSIDDISKHSLHLEVYYYGTDDRWVLLEPRVCEVCALCMVAVS